MAKNAINYTGIIPEIGDSFESATQNTTGSLEGIDTKLGELDSGKLESGGYIGNAQDLKDEIGLKAPINNPTFTGNPTTPTPSLSDTGTSVATTEFVKGVAGNKYTFDTIEEAQAYSGFVEGDRIQTLGYYSKNDGAGHERIYSLADDGSGVACGVGFLNIVYKDCIQLKWFGAKGNGVDDDYIFIKKAHSTGKKIIYEKDKNYYISNYISIIKDFICVGNNSNIIYKNGLKNCFVIEDNINIFSLEDLNFKILNETLDLLTYINSVNFMKTLEFTGYPIDDSYTCNFLKIENCNFSLTRVFLGKSNKNANIKNNTFIFSEAKIMPASMCLYYSEKCLIENNVFKGKYFGYNENADVLKIIGTKNIDISNNTFEQLIQNYTAQLDMYTGGYNCTIHNNNFKNVQVLRKQTGVDITIVRYDKIINNHFELDLSNGTGNSLIYWRGSRGLVSSNTFIVKNSTQGIAISCINCEEEDYIYDEFNTTLVSSLNISNNIIDFQTTIGTLVGIRIVTTGTYTESEFVTVIGNHQIGGNRFVQSSVYVLVGNSWRNPYNPTGEVTAKIASGNFFPKTGSFLLSPSNNNALTKWVDVKTDLPSVNNTSFLRISNPITLTDILDSFIGQIIYIDIPLIGVTITHNTSKIALNGSANFVTTATRNSLTLIRTQTGFWQEIGRSKG